MVGRRCDWPLVGLEDLEGDLAPNPAGARRASAWDGKVKEA